MKKYQLLSILLFIGAIITSCQESKTELQKFEEELGFNYPDEFKNYIKDLDDDKLNVIHVLHDSFQVITPNNIGILDDQVFSKFGLVEYLEKYVSQELKLKKFKPLPFARSLSGDKYGFLFFIKSVEEYSEMMIFHRDIDRLIYETAALGEFSNYFGNKIDLKDRVHLTNEKSAAKFLGKYPKIEMLEYISEKIISNNQTEMKDDFTTKISFNVVENGTNVKIMHNLISANRLIKYEANYFDNNIRRQYSYQNNLSYNYFSAIHYYVIETIMRFKNLETIKSSDFEEILENKSITELVKKGTK